MKRRPVDDPDQPLSMLMAHWPATIPVFLRHKMLCVGCAIGPFHTIVDACQEHDVDEDSFAAELRAAVSRPPD